MSKKQYSPEIIATLEKLRLMDDTLMAYAFEDNTEAGTLLLQILIGRDDLIAEEVRTQREYTNPLGHTVRLDVVARDGEGKLYNIEVQRSDEGANPRRARYHSSMLDSRLLEKNKDYATLKDSYVIFITENDVFRSGLPLYHFERMLLEGGRPLNDGSHIIYVNGAYENSEDPVGKLMHDFRCRNADEMIYPILAERVRYLKEDEGGQSFMCQVIEELNRKTAQETAKREREHFARELLVRSTFSEEEIAEISRLSLEEVKALNAQRTA